MATLNWFKGKGVYNRQLGDERGARSFLPEGVLFSASLESLPQGSIDPRPLPHPGLSDLIAQLDDEGFVTQQSAGTLIAWDHVYHLLSSSDYPEFAVLARLPSPRSWIPTLDSFGSLSDTTFAIVVEGWSELTGNQLRSVSVYGAIAECNGELGLLAKPVWELLSAIQKFKSRSDDDRNDVSQRRLWGQIRRLAISAGARLDGFLYKNIVLTPDKLDIGLRKGDVEGSRVVEVIPSFAGAPADWLLHFDRRADVPSRYDIPTPDGIIQILLSDDVRTVLTAIKRFPGRRVAGTRAEAFLINPFAALGSAASSTIDEAQFEQARDQAGLQFERFTAHVQHDVFGYPIEVGLRIEATAGASPSDVHLFANDDEIAEFINQVEAASSAGYQLCAWRGFDFELFGDTQQEVERLKAALSARAKPRVLVSYASIYDLSSYSSRIEDIGQEKPYYSPFIAKKKDDDGWFPENVVPVISWVPDGESEPVAVPLTPDVRKQFELKLDLAKAKGEADFSIKGFDRPIPTQNAEAILRTFGNVEREIQSRTFDPDKPKSVTEPRQKKHLVLKANIQSIDYEEARRDILATVERPAQLPFALRPETSLKEHQFAGVAWLQHLHENAPQYCRGAVLADDMGLGKTLQLLVFLVNMFERHPSLPPALVVAPVSLLENWEEEIVKFFNPDAVSILTAYGDALSAIRVPRDAVDAQLKADGLVRFLKPGWRAKAQIVLTTYETLRDLEFSFAAEKWSVMVCDEAQKIKNPNAMVTRDAKKQNVMFRVACTGTPVENTLADLWCLFDFIQPGLLGALNDFGRRYRRPIEAETDEEQARVKELRELIAPQIMRRTKEDVAKELKPKTRVPCRIPLSSYQRSLYAQAIELFKRRNHSDSVSPFKNHLGLLHYLRLICTDPRHVGVSVFQPEPLHEYRTRAPKLGWLMETLESICRKGEKAIVFCEFREMQRMLRHYIEEVFGIAPDIINGDISASAKRADSRQKRIKAFQQRPGFGVIILSPVAVGFGVNIQEANHVIHYTRTWNPAKEDQATDRAYRIGQRREVHVYCPVVYADDFTTFDIRLDQLLTTKRALAADMLNGSGDIGPGEFNLDEIVPEEHAAALSRVIVMSDVLSMEWDYFECLVAALWQKRGFKLVYRTPVQDDGVDVVALHAEDGILIQCKSCGVDGHTLGWDAIKEVVGGEASYRARHPGVSFKKACVTNQHFNGAARRHAELNEVELIERADLAQLLETFPVRSSDIERLLFPEWPGAF